MKTKLAGTLAAVLLSVVGLAAQQKSNEPAMTPVKLTIVLSEFDGGKKVSSLPYVLPLSASTDRSVDRGFLRVGLRVPIREGRVEREKGQQPVISEVTTYEDVGTDIDCNVRPREDGQFLVDFNLQRNSVYSPESQQVRSFSDKPVFNRVQVEQTLLLRDGETVEAATATDPISGRVTKVSVTLNVAK